MLNKYLVLYVFICGYAITESAAWRPYFITTTNITSYSMVDFVEINSTLINGAISIYVNVLEDIRNIYAMVKIIFQSTKGNYDLKMMDKNVDCCKFFKDKKYEPILQKLYRVFTKTGSFPHGCPFPKNMYALKNAVIDAEDFPPAMPDRKGFANITVLTKNGSGELTSLYGFALYFETSQLYKKSN